MVMAMVPVKISSLMMNAKPRIHSAAMAATASHPFHCWPAARVVIQRLTGGSRRMTRGMLMATAW
jgi:hypothetical protein